MRPAWQYIGLGALAGLAFAGVVLALPSEGLWPLLLAQLIVLVPALPILLPAGVFLFNSVLAGANSGVWPAMYGAGLFAWAVIGGLVGLRRYNARCGVIGCRPVNGNRAAIVVLVLCVLAAAAECAYMAHRAARVTYSKVTLKELTELTTVTFPAGSVLTRSELRRDCDGRGLWARVTFPASQAKAFVKSNEPMQVTSCEGLLDFPTDFSRTHCPTWYKPPLSGKVKCYAKCPIYVEDTSFISVARDSAGSAEVYLHWFRSSM